MSESASALFSIADAGEFQFTRFYIVCEEVPIGTPESPPIISGVPDMYPSDYQTWKRHGIRCKHSAGRNAHIFLQRIFHLHFHMKSQSVFLIILLIKARYAYCGSSFYIPFLFCKNEGRIYIGVRSHFGRMACIDAFFLYC